MIKALNQAGEVAVSKVSTFIRRSGWPAQTPAMTWFQWSSAPLAALLVFGILAPMGRAEEDHDRARAALEAGQVRPLAEILERVRRDYPGEVIDVELEESHGRGHRFGRAVPGDDDGPPIVYEIKVRMADGRIIKACYDALTGVQRSVRTR